MARNIFPKNNLPSKSRVSFTRLFSASWTGESLTNTDARKLLDELKTWASQAEHENAKGLKVAFDELEMLFFFVWNEIESSLDRLDQIEMRGASATDNDHLAAAKHYLRRWQDKGWRNALVRPTTFR